MDSAKETAEALVREIYAAGQETGLHGCNVMLSPYAKKYTDAIMALLPQVGVRPLVWETTSSKDGPFDFDGEFAVTGVGRIYAIEPDGGSFLVGRLGDDPIWEKQSLTDARAVAEEDWRLLVTSSAIVLAKPDQADFAQRITSALVPPSGVVSDAMVSSLMTALYGPAWEGMPSEPLNDTWDRVKAALTAALASPVSEGEIRATPDIPRDEPTVRVQIHGGGIAGVDESIAPLVKLLNDGGFKTVASCSGHGQRPGNIALADGRELLIARNWNEARLIDGLFPGINGEPARGVDGALEFIRHSNEEVRADERERLAKLLDGDTKGTVNRSAIPKWLRSLTNGDG